MTAMATRTDVHPFAESALVPGWQWRAREGDLVPAAMETRHLFYTLRMIWNHTMPAHMTVGGNVKRWRFGDRHPMDYMGEAVVQVGAELFRRRDLAPWQRDQLEQMARWLQGRILETKPLPAPAADLVKGAP